MIAVFLLKIDADVLPPKESRGNQVAAKIQRTDPGRHFQHWSTLLDAKKAAVWAEPPSAPLRTRSPCQSGLDGDHCTARFSSRDRRRAFKIHFVADLPEIHINKLHQRVPEAARFLDQHLLLPQLGRML